MVEVSRGTLAQLNGPTIETRVIRFGSEEKQRSVELRPLDIVDEWKFSRITAGTESRQWRYMSLLAFCLVSVDGKPALMMQAQPTLEDIEGRLKQLGSDGVAAVMDADQQELQTATADQAKPADDPEAARVAQVGNSSEPAPSAT